jgi:hypothetical protein
MNYETGRYLAVDAVGVRIGMMDGDEFIRDHSGRLIYRVDGDEVYTLDGVLLGNLDFGQLVVNRKIIFKLVLE